MPERPIYFTTEDVERVLDSIELQLEADELIPYYIGEYDAEGEGALPVRWEYNPRRARPAVNGSAIAVAVILIVLGCAGSIGLFIYCACTSIGQTW